MNVTRVCVLLLLLMISSCATTKGSSKVKFIEGNGISYDSTKLYIFFEEGFKNTRVNVFLDSFNIYNDSISTTKSIGLASELMIDFPQKGQILLINLNNKEYKITFPVERGYNILLLNKTMLKNKLIFQRKHYYYD